MAKNGMKWMFFVPKKRQGKSFLAASVDIADEISNIKFIEDFDKIVNFMLSSTIVTTKPHRW